MYRIAIADDDILHLKNIRIHAENILGEKIQSITEFSDTKDILGFIETRGFPFDIVIMDIEFSDSASNGIDLAAVIRKASAECQIIFCTGYLSYATAVYDVEHTYYVLKTELEKRLPLALCKAVQRLRELRTRMFMVSVKGKDIIIDQNDVLYFERMQRITQINLRNDIISCYEPIESILPRLTPDLFFQCHKSYAVNLSKIRIYRKNSVMLINNKLIPISRANVHSMSEAFLKYADMHI